MKKTLKNILRNMGFEVRKYTTSSSELARLQHFLKFYNINLVLDVGANVGQYAKLLRQLGYREKIISFEPLTAAHKELLQASKNDSLWEIAPRMAISNKKSDVEIKISKNSFSSSVLDMHDNHLRAAPNSIFIDKEMVSAYRLDDVISSVFCNKNKSIFLKIDVQGLEKQVLEGAEKALAFVVGIQVELSLVPLYQDQPLFIEMVEYLQTKGYEIYSLIPGFTDKETGRVLQVDGIFLRQT